MAARVVEQGGVGAQVQRNVRALRERRGMSLANLSDEMRRLGRPLAPSALLRIEQGTRRTDTDDLVALAVALNVSPNRLLLPPNADDWESGARYHITPTVEVSPAQAWYWAKGHGPLCPDDDVAHLLNRQVADYGVEEPDAMWRGTPPSDFVVEEGTGRVLRFPPPRTGPGSLKVRENPREEEQR